MDYMLNLEKGVSPKKERKLSHAHTPTPTIHQFDVTYEKEIHSLLESKKQDNKTKIIGVYSTKLDETLKRLLFSFNSL